MVPFISEWLSDCWYRLGLVPFWLCSLAPPVGSGGLLHPNRSGSTNSGFLATQITDVGQSCIQSPLKSSRGSEGVFFHSVSLAVLSSRPVLGLLGGCFGLLRCRGGLWRCVSRRIGTTPPGGRSAEGERSFATEAVGQQALFVQVHLRVRTAHLTEDQKTEPL